ncbi:SOS response-associated peptidase [Photobacterium sp. 1_MG-2023]|uniref:SOS response-associated peptidase n=1 Tax=Photobacterium sp. 1_MG-2023 TaxID=3062646 RepID=UPI0026E35E99|nr:SOS response-associated peptidase [Photobacterium sp. 1_MG-2023]MDO6707944.1 SOS response-associated peptidase [Photobacterium sp. 1_MG-2023]
MCGRLNILANMLNNQVSDELRIRFEAEENTDLRPTQKVSTVVKGPDGLQQLDMVWGIQPSWSKKLLINAQEESAMQKPTWRNAMQTHRCIVPCSGWYEWRDEGDSKKQRYLFSHPYGKPLYMAGIWFEAETPQLVTLTTAANEVCLPYHHRMPVIADINGCDAWLDNGNDSNSEIENLKIINM